MNDWISSRQVDIELARNFLEQHATLHSLLQSGGEVLDVVIQDEYTHDVIAQLPVSANLIMVVFDST